MDHYMLSSDMSQTAREQLNQLVSWSLTSLFSTNMAISEMKHLYVHNSIQYKQTRPTTKTV